MKEGKSFKFDKSERKYENNPYPGPGHYKVPSKFADLPKYAIPDMGEENRWVWTIENNILFLNEYFNQVNFYT